MPRKAEVGIERVGDWNRWAGCRSAEREGRKYVVFSVPFVSCCSVASKIKLIFILPLYPEPPQVLGSVEEYSCLDFSASTIFS